MKEPTLPSEQLFCDFKAKIFSKSWFLSWINVFGAFQSWLGEIEKSAWLVRTLYKFLPPLEKSEKAFWRRNLLQLDLCFSPKKTGFGQQGNLNRHKSKCRRNPASNITIAELMTENNIQAVSYLYFTLSSNMLRRIRIRCYNPFFRKISAEYLRIALFPLYFALLAQKFYALNCFRLSKTDFYVEIENKDKTWAFVYRNPR